MPTTVIQNTIRGLVAAGILFLVTVFVLGFLSYRLTDLDFWTIHTHQVTEQLQDSLAALQDIETGERGYLLTRRSEFLEPYHWGLENAKLHIGNVANLTADNPEERLQIIKLRNLADKRMSLSQTSIALEKTKSDELLELQRAGKKTMDAFRDQVKVMVEIESKLLRKRVFELQVTRYLVWAATAILGIAAAALLIWVGRITRREIRDEKKRGDLLAQEIEQRKRTEKALKETTINLSRSNADLQQFAYVASHDLQEPLRAVTGFLTLLSSKKAASLDEEGQKYVNHAVEGAHRMRTLVNDLLAYARVESSAKIFETVSLEKILERVKTDLSASIEESGAKIIAPEMPDIPGDKTQLAQLFLNLIGNAIKFRSDKPPEIKIEFTPADEEIMFSIRDNGKGFSMEYAERIFVIFQRLQGREEASGTGIGLALCKKIVERHNGRIWVESVIGQGSTFFFTLSRQTGEAKHNATS